MVRLLAGSFATVIAYALNGPIDKLFSMGPGMVIDTIVFVVVFYFAHKFLSDLRGG